MRHIARTMMCLTAAAAVLAAAGCYILPGETLEITLSLLPADGTSPVEIAGGSLLVQKRSPDETQTSITLLVGGFADKGINNLMLEHDGVEVPLDYTRRFPRTWEAEVTLTLDEPRELLVFRIADEGSNQDARALTVYYDPDIIDEVFVAGLPAAAVHSFRVGEPLHIVAALHPDIVGEYEIQVQRDRWNGTAYEADRALAPYDYHEAAASLPGRYLYTVQALDPASGYGESVQFVLYAHNVVATPPAPVPADLRYAHVNDASLQIAFDWGDLDAVVRPGGWVVEIRSSLELPANVSHALVSGTGTSVALVSVGEYVARVGITSGDVTAYSPTFYSGIRGTNAAPAQPASPALGTFSRGDPVSFIISTTDPESDPFTFEMGKGTLGELIVTYDSDIPGYTFSYRDNTPGTFNAQTGEFAWVIPPNLAPQISAFILTFRAVDKFAAASPDREVTFSL